MLINISFQSSLIEVLWCGIFTTSSLIFSLIHFVFHKKYSLDSSKWTYILLFVLFPIYFLSNYIELIYPNSHLYLIEGVYLNLIYYLTYKCIRQNYTKEELYNTYQVKPLILGGIFQYILVQLLLSITSLVLFLIGLYEIGNFNWKTNSYLYIISTCILSQIVGIYSLFSFSLSVKNSSFRKVVLFLLVSFFSFWQFFIINLVINFHVLPFEQKESVYLQKFLFCFESFVLSIFTWICFPSSQLLPTTTTANTKFNDIKEVSVDLPRRASLSNIISKQNIKIEPNQLVITQSSLPNSSPLIFNLVPNKNRKARPNNYVLHLPSYNRIRTKI